MVAASVAAESQREALPNNSTASKPGTLPLWQFDCSLTLGRVNGGPAPSCPAGLDLPGSPQYGLGYGVGRSGSGCSALAFGLCQDAGWLVGNPIWEANE